MKTEHAFTSVSVVLLILVVAYIGGYLESVRRLQVSYGSPRGSLIATYDYTWQRTLFRPVERLDRVIFSARWRYASGASQAEVPEGRYENSPGQAQRRRTGEIISSFFPSGLARKQCAKPEGEKRLGGVALYPGRWPRRPCPGLLSCSPSGAPERPTSGFRQQPPRL